MNKEKKSKGRLLRLIKACFNWKVLLSVVLGIGLIILLAWAVLQYLNIYTRHGEETNVPNVTKLNLFDAEVTLENEGFKVELDTFKFDDRYKPFQIISIYPEPGSKVKKGRRIFIRANPKTYRPVAVPNLIDKPRDLAFTQLEIVGLSVGDTIYEPYLYSNIVLRMMYNGREVSPGKEVPRFSKIDLVIGKGLEDDVIVPDFRGYSYKEAQQLLSENYFELGIANFNDFKDSAVAKVYFQSPPAGSVYDQGRSIDLWLSDKSPEDLEDEIIKLNGTYNNFERIDTTQSAVNKEKKTETKKKVTKPVETTNQPKQDDAIIIID